MSQDCTKKTANHKIGKDFTNLKETKLNPFSFCLNAKSICITNLGQNQAV